MHIVVVKVQQKYSKRNYYYTSIKMNRMTKFGRLTALNAVEDVEWQEISFIAGGKAKMVQQFWKTFSDFLQNKCIPKIRYRNNY